MSTEQIRPFLLVALCFVGLLLWQAWQRDYGGKPPATMPAAGESGTSAAAPSKHAASSPDVPQVVPGERAGAAGAGAPVEAAAAPSAGIDVVTDVYRARIELKGGTLSDLELLDYPVSLKEPNDPFPLLVHAGPKLFTAQSGVVGKVDAPTHHAVYTAARREYSMDGKDRLSVPLVWEEGGVRVTKTYLFKRGSYVIQVDYHVENRSNEPWSGRVYGQFRRIAPKQKRRLGTIYTYTGGVISSPEKPYQKYKFSEMEDKDLDRDIKGGWVAMIQHYFVGAWIPGADAEAHYYSKALSKSEYVLGVVAPPLTVAPGASGDSSLRLFLGPKLQKDLEATAPGLERTVDYGWLFFIAEPLYIALKHIHGFLGNWGWSIIVLTILVKTAFFPLSNASYKSMARMRKMQPKITSLKERFGDDRQKMNQAMMELYKKEKINPLGGCLPIVVQIPVFISLYWVLLETVELRQAPFMFWLKDLSTYDPHYVLPILMGISMFAQQRLSPTPPDPIQAKVMMAMPVIFTFFFLFFPSGLVLYWLCNNLLSITQQWFITRRIEAAGK